MWNAHQYLRYADERSRPFFDLVGRIDRDEATAVVDLGSGPGQLTATLADRWPAASIVGVDNSADMVAAAAADQTDRVRFELADLRSWAPSGPLDAIVSNATLQWLPDHLELLARLVSWLSPGGVLAFQVPGNFRASVPPAPGRSTALPQVARPGGGGRGPAPRRLGPHRLRRGARRPRL